MTHVVGDGYSLVNWALTGMCAASLTLQAYLFYLIVYVSPQAMREYRPFLLLITVKSNFISADGLS